MYMDNAKRKNMSLILVTVFLFTILFVLAVSSNMRNTQMPRIKETYGISLTEVGFFTATMSIGMLLSSFVSGIIGDRFKKKTILAILFPIYIGLLFIIGATPSFLILTLGFLLIGMLTSMMILIGNTFVAELFPAKKAMGLNLLHMVWAIGSVVSPMYVTFTYNKGYHWSGDYTFWALASIAVAALFYVVLYVTKFDAGRSEKVGRDGEKSKGGYLALLKERYLLYICLFAFIQMAFQNLLMLWMPLYFDDLGYAANVMGDLVTLLWVGMTIGRLLYSLFSARIDMILYLKTVSIVGPCAMFVCLFINAYWLWLVMLPIFGVLISAIYPLSVAITCELYPDRATSANAVTGITGSIGAVIMSALIGFVADNFGFTVAMAIPAVMYLTVFFILSVAKFPIPKPVRKPKPKPAT